MILECTWKLIFNGVDRGQLFDALCGPVGTPETDVRRGWFEGACNSLEFEADAETCNASVDVHGLADLRELLAATEGLQTNWGIVLHLCARESDESPTTVYASICQPGLAEGYKPTDCRLSFSPNKQNNVILTQDLLAAENLIRRVRDNLKLLDK